MLIIVIENVLFSLETFDSVYCFSIILVSMISLYITTVHRIQIEVQAISAKIIYQKSTQHGNILNTI